MSKTNPLEATLKGLKNWQRSLDAAEAAIVYERGKYWVLKKERGFEVYEAGITHSTRRAIIGFTGDVGLKRAIEEIDRRVLRDQAALAPPAPRPRAMSKVDRRTPSLFPDLAALPV